MNLYGSYRALVNNSKAAMLAAIEIYNKPQISYRDECFTILLVNSWELLLKAMLSKSRKRIYYPKERGEPYRTFSIKDALKKCKDIFPTPINYEAVEANILMLVTYRDNAIHFYNQEDIGILVYGLAQTGIINYSDLLLEFFDYDLKRDITLQLLPLGFGTLPDPIEFLKHSSKQLPRNKAVAAFIKEIFEITNDLEVKNIDTQRFLTVFTMSFQSIKKIESADIVTGVSTNDDDTEDILIVQRDRDPNQTHPYRQKDILDKFGKNLSGVKFTQYTFQAIIWKYKLKEDRRYYWMLDNGVSPRYSGAVIHFLKQLKQSDIEQSLRDYSYFQSQTRKRQKFRHSA